jgi:hypothetical protein
VVDVRIILSGLWVALMLTYLLGDVLRIFAGDAVPGEMAGVKATQGMFLGAAVIMSVPIAMVVLSLDIAISRNPLGQHHRRRSCRCVQSSRLALRGYVRQLSDRCGVRVQRIDHLVCLDLDLGHPLKQCI